MTIVFVLPGQRFTDGFLSSWNKVFQHFLQRAETAVYTCISASSNVTSVRNMAVGRDVFRGEDYDWCMWIDSDTIFEASDIELLLAADKDIISGLVPTTTEADLGVGYFREDGRLRPVNQKNLPDQDNPFEVSYAGFGFILIRKGVFEKMGYPPFTMTAVDWEGRPIVYGEDVQWCLRAKHLGYSIWAHPKVMLGHQKTITLW